MSEKSTAISFAIGFIVVVSFAAWWQASVWRECRQDHHSWMYCVSLMGR